MLERLKEILNSYTFLGPKDVLQLVSIGNLKRIKKGEHIIHMGEHNYNAIFVILGLLKSYTINENGDEVTLAFVPEKKNIASYKTILSGKPSIENVVAVEDSWVLITDGRKLDKLVETNKSIMYMQNKILKEVLRSSLDNMMSHIILTPEQRYNKFCEDYPRLQQRVAQKDLASYIGVTPTSLSRIRARMAQHKK
ncbi:MAG: Crp/Fnr family transcriptional regulator [Chitinophagaceae bacterium]|nr:Crp/Fnr family transcriptional regulator [Chitinophagaceae bacterium]